MRRGTIALGNNRNGLQIAVATLGIVLAGAHLAFDFLIVHNQNPPLPYISLTVRFTFYSICFKIKKKASKETECYESILD